MIFRELGIPGVFVIDVEPATDERGLFARTFCTEEFAAAGIPFPVAQVSVSFNAVRGTLRGMHFQRAPHEESKLVRCTVGRAHDVVVDLRPSSPTARQWVAVELSAAARNAVYVPAGCAHGFLTLEDATELEYLISVPYVADAADGVRWDDPALGIDWPAEPEVISERDTAFALLD